jgi:glycosyltransferase involved in cell wall biosynthesis
VDHVMLVLHAASQAQVAMLDSVPMRILQICSAREIGGGEKHLADLANTLVKRGHEVFAALSPESPVAPLLSSVASCNRIEFSMRNSLNLATAIKLSRFVRTNGIEIVHAHVARDYPLAALATGRSGAQLVLTRHVLFPLHRIHRLTLRRTARVIAVSRAVAESIHSQNVFEAQKVVIIHNGIDLDRFQNLKAGRARDRKLRIGTVGHIAAIKGHEEFVRAAAIVSQHHADIEFVIAGEDKSASHENQRALEKLIRELRMDEYVKLIGWQDDMPGFLSTLDLFVSAARSEPFGLSIVEAMAAGVPVIATASEGAREIIDDNQTGRLVPIENAPALAKAIQALLSDCAAQSRLSANACAAVARRFSLGQMVDATEHLYRQAIDNER